MRSTIAVVGANLAGGHAAHTLRREGFDGRIVLIGAEPHLPYERPPLSKAVLTGAAKPETTLVWPEAAYDDAAIDTELGVRVERLVPNERRLELADGRSLTADQVLLCTGARPRPMPVGEVVLSGMHDLRTLDDALALRAELQPGVRLLVVGAGFIGAEVAASAVSMGCEVTMVEVAASPLQRVLGPAVGALYAALHRSHGVDLRLGVGIQSVEGDTHCRAVELTDGSRVAVDVIVFGVGVMPACELADSAGIAVANGVVVDERCRTSMNEVFAAGDVASRPSSFTDGHVRLETWQNAQNHSIAAAKAMLGHDVCFDDVPWFWSDQYDVNLQVAGLPLGHHEVVWRGSGEAMDGVAFYLDEGVLKGAVGLNRSREVRGAMALIAARQTVDTESLADETVDLRRLAALR